MISLDAPSTERDGAPLESEGLLELLYEELRRLARRALAGEANGLTLQPTALVHEAWLRLSAEGRGHWESRAQFFSAASTAMRRILVERARRAGRLKRGAALHRAALVEDALPAAAAPSDELLALDQALVELERLDRRAFEVVQLRYFAGLSVEEVAAVLASSPRTVRRDWAAARLWLFRTITGGADRDGT